MISLSIQYPFPSKKSLHHPYQLGHTKISENIFYKIIETKYTTNFRYHKFLFQTKEYEPYETPSRTRFERGDNEVTTDIV